MEVSGELHAPVILSQGKNAGAHRTRGWVGPTVGHYVLEERKSLAPVDCQSLEGSQDLRLQGQVVEEDWTA